jgi:hypothetical protein
MPVRQSADPRAAFTAHQKFLRDKIAEKSRRDAMIALRMRATGHSQEAVAATVRENAPEAHQETRDWNRYADRTTAYAFGVAGDVELAQRLRFLEQWKRIEGMEKEPDAPKPEEPDAEAPRRRMR